MNKKKERNLMRNRKSIYWFDAQWKTIKAKKKKKKEEKIFPKENTVTFVSYFLIFFNGLLVNLNIRIKSVAWSTHPDTFKSIRHI